jgi:acetyl esterase/lipase
MLIFRLRATAALALLFLFVHSAAQAQICQTLSGLPYGSYADRNGQPQVLLLDLLLPEGAAGPTPLVLWIHGGGWSTGSRLPVPSYVARLCTLGYAVASVDYRLMGVAPWPAQIEDVKGAVRYLRAQATAYNLDPDRFAAWGESAGGQLAAMLGTSGGIGTYNLGAVSVDLEGSTGGNRGVSSRVQAVVDWYGATDFLQMRFYPSSRNHDDPRSDESVFVGGPIEANPERTETANPGTYASPDDPPFLLMHGTADPLIPFNQSELLRDALLAQGVRTRFVPVANAGHGNSPWTSSAAIWQEVYDFLAGTLLAAPPVRVSVLASAGGSEAGPARVFTISRTGSTAAPLTVRWALSGTATPGADYTATPSAGPLGGALTIPAGAAFARVRIAPVADSLVEGNETVTLALASDPSYGIAAAQATATLVFADATPPGTGGGATGGGAAGRPAIFVSASTAPGVHPFTVTRTGSTSRGLTVAYTLAGTAIPGVDYAALPGTLRIRPGAASATVDVTPLPRGEPQPARFVVLALAASPFYQAGLPAEESVVLAADALTEPVVSVSATAPAAGPGTAGAFQLSRTGSTAAPLTVRITAGGTARSGIDYAAVPATVTFPTGASRVTVPIQPLAGSPAGSTEAVTLSVEPDPSYLVGPYRGSRVTIVTP